MKILSIFKGFVTNSSSANYWLEDEDYHITTSTEGQVIKPNSIPNNQVNKNTSSINSIVIFLSFSVIVAIVLIIRKIKKV